MVIAKFYKKMLLFLLFTSFLSQKDSQALPVRATALAMSCGFIGAGVGALAAPMTFLVRAAKGLHRARTMKHAYENGPNGELLEIDDEVAFQNTRRKQLIKYGVLLPTSVAAFVLSAIPALALGVVGIGAGSGAIHLFRPGSTYDKYGKKAEALAEEIAKELKTSDGRSKLMSEIKDVFNSKDAANLA